MNDRTNPTWNAVDDYFVHRLSLIDDALDAALKDSAAAGLPAINVTAAQGKLLALLAQIGGAGRILEIGTLGGFSTIMMARALPPGGELVTLEISPVNAAVARKNIDRAGLTSRTKIIVGPASESLAAMIAQKVTPFDLVFIDADKQSSVEYFDAALRLARVGSIIVVDNVVREGAIIDGESQDPNVLGMRRLAEHLTGESRVSTTAIQTVGSKGYDGFILAVVTSL